MRTCNLDEVRVWEKKLISDPKPHFFLIWEKLGKEFGKRKLLSSFEEAYNYFKTLKDEESRFSQSFHAKILKPLKDEKNRTYIKRSIYDKLMSIYGKFISIKENYGEAIFTTTKLSPQLEKKTKTLRRETKSKIKKNFQEKNPYPQDWAKHKRDILLTEIASYKAALEGLEYPKDSDYEEKIRNCKDEIINLETRYKI